MKTSFDLVLAHSFIGYIGKKNMEVGDFMLITALSMLLLLKIASLFLQLMNHWMS